jgi:PAS domain S-box-containing protein
VGKEPRKSPRPSARRQADPQTGGARDAAAYASAIGGAGPLTESSGLHRLLVEKVEDYAIFALDTEGHILSWNAGAERFKGYTESEILGKHYSIFYPEQDRAANKPARLLAEATSKGHVEDEGWRVRKNGTRFWANVIITALRDETGTLVGFAKVTRDLTERKKAEETLRLSEERFRLLVSSVKDYAIFMLDPNGFIVSWNEGAKRLKGYEPEEILGKHFSVFYPPTDVEAHKPEKELLTAMAHGRVEDEDWRVRKDGTLFWANVVITAVRDEHGKHVGFAKVTRDLTERRKAELRAIDDARRIALAEASSRAKGDFLAAMSHELRTPLNAIGGYAELMELGLAGPLNEQHREYLKRIRTSQQHLLAIINDLLNYSKIEAGQVTYDIEQIDLRTVADRVVEMIAPQAAAKEIKLEWPSGPTEVPARSDRQKAEQIVLNMLSNAVKFTPNGGRVTLSCYLAGDRAIIAVADSGPGIPPDKLSDIFEPFVQLGRSLSTIREGTGLGLAISRDLARAMKGEIVVESEVGKGSRFALSLPGA